MSAADALAQAAKQEAHVTVFEAWQRVMTDVQAVGKTGWNKNQEYPFRGVDAVMNAVGPALRTHGVVIVPSIGKVEVRDVASARGTLMREVRVEVTYRVYGPQGDWFSGSVPGEALDTGDKATAKAMSVAYRTFLLQALTIPTDEPDPDADSFQRAEPQLEAFQQALADAISAMTEDEKQELRDWWRGAGLASLSHLTAEEAAAVTNQVERIVNKETTDKGAE